MALTAAAGPGRVPCVKGYPDSFDRGLPSGSLFLYLEIVGFDLKAA